MSPAHAAEDIVITSSHQPTVSAMILITITLAVTLVVAFWSWQRRRGLLARRREVELALRASEERLRQVSSQLPVALFQYVAGPVAAFSSMSDGVARLLPAGAAEMLADPQAFFAGIHPDDLAGLTWRDAATPPAGEFEWVGRSRTPGSPGQPARWLQIRATTEITPAGLPAVHGVILDVTALKQAQQALERSRQELRRLARHRETRIEQERAHLAREVHDELGQVLTAARMQLQLLRGKLSPDGTMKDAVQHIDATESLIAEAYRSVKTIASDLRPAALNLGLTAAVEWLAERLLKPAGVACEIRFTAEADSLGEAQNIGLFRIVQESLSNIVRHAAATKVTLGFEKSGRTTRLTIRDDGRGFDPAGVDRREHFGLLGMVERAEALGGSLSVDSRPAQGTTLTVEITT